MVIFGKDDIIIEGGTGWTDPSSEGRREERFKRWLSPPNVKFSSPEAEQGYQARGKRSLKVIKLEEPDRVPAIHLSPLRRKLQINGRLL
ncbi:MAG TPA: hypothetical protein VMV04_05680 [Thermodesulfobacteriota bacterium]|nr:hypothetical protein [Thermodesulfobacteriota bacterium]